MKNVLSNPLKKLVFYFFAICIFITMTIMSCTDNQKARIYGGTQTIHLESGQRLINATWKQDNLWFITEPMDSDYVPKTKTFHESSNFGVWQGSVVFIESR